MGATYIKSVKQDFEWLVQAIKYAAYHVDQGLWNKSNMGAFLKTCAIAKRVRDHLLLVVRDQKC